jgi:hypothetical protein
MKYFRRDNVYLTKYDDQLSYLQKSLQQPQNVRESDKILGYLCGLVVRVPGYRSRGLGFDFRRYQIF